MSELKKHIRTPETHSITRFAAPVTASLFISVVLIAVLAAPPPASALELTSQRTETHVMVPGTNAFFAPAPGLALASEFIGFESKNRMIEVIVAYLDGPIDGIEEGFTEASFASLGMNMMAKGNFTIDSRRAVLYKVSHDHGNMTWGKWVMLAENGTGTLVVNAVFVSGDTDAALELEQMLKGVYFEPVVAAAAREEANPAEPESENTAQPGEASTVVASGGDGGQTASPEARPLARNVDALLSVDEDDSFDKDEALSILAREVGSTPDAASNDESARPAPEDTEAEKTESESEPADETPTAPERRGAARIITEDGIIYAGENTEAD